MSEREPITGESAPFSGAEFRSVFQGAPDASVIVDTDGRIVAVNEEVEPLLGYASEELIGEPVEILVPEALRNAHEADREAYTRAPEKRPMGIGRELFARHRDGFEIPVEIGLSPIETRHGRYVLAVVHDISERRRLRAFGAGVLEGAEEERRRIARELHDDTAQSLAALVLRLQMARRSRDPATRERLLRELHDEIHRASAGVRRILRGLRPPLLEESGLVAAVRSHLKSALAEAALEHSLEAGEVEHLLSQDAKLALYRIIQEAVSNVVRHSGATHVAVRLAAEGERVRVEVQDDGVGFDRARSDPAGGRGLGIVGILERAAILGGAASVDSRPGEGTHVVVRVPADTGG